MVEGVEEEGEGQELTTVPDGIQVALSWNDPQSVDRPVVQPPVQREEHLRQGVEEEEGGEGEV